MIDGFEFAAAGDSMRGAWPAGEFARLREWLHDEAGTVEYELRGRLDAAGRHLLDLSVSATLRLICRRCLEALEVSLREEVTLWLAALQAEIDAQPLDAEGPDSIVASQEMTVKPLAGVFSR